ncbi:hypothetical protein RCL1_002901 [Eukaryota sp. TZLM3-RCL]
MGNRSTSMTVPEEPSLTTSQELSTFIESIPVFTLEQYSAFCDNLPTTPESNPSINKVDVFSVILYKDSNNSQFKLFPNIVPFLCQLLTSTEDVNEAFLLLTAIANTILHCTLFYQVAPLVNTLTLFSSKSFTKEYVTKYPYLFSEFARCAHNLCSLTTIIQIEKSNISIILKFIISLLEDFIIAEMGMEPFVSLLKSFVFITCTYEIEFILKETVFAQVIENLLFAPFLFLFVLQYFITKPQYFLSAKQVTDFSKNNLAEYLSIVVDRLSLNFIVSRILPFCTSKSVPLYPDTLGYIITHALILNHSEEALLNITRYVVTVVVPLLEKGKPKLSSDRSSPMFGDSVLYLFDVLSAALAKGIVHVWILDLCLQLESIVKNKLSRSKLKAALELQRGKVDEEFVTKFDLLLTKL